MVLKTHKLPQIISKKHFQHYLRLSYLKESSIFREIVALNQKDIDALKELGILLYEESNDPLKWKEFVYKSSLDSPVFTAIQNHSQNLLKNFSEIYWIGSEEDKNTNKYIIGSIFDQIVIHIFKNTCFNEPKKIFVTNLKKNNVIFYFPLVADFILYYITSNKNKESLERLTILKYISEILEKNRNKRLVLYYLDKIHIVDEILQK